MRQRIVAYHFNLVAETIKSIPEVKDKVNFYSYDTGVNGFPTRIPYLTVAPPDLTGDRADEKSGLPAIFFLPSGKKLVPYMKYDNQAYGAELLEYIVKESTQDLKINIYKYDELGYSEEDAMAFLDKLKAEGVMDLKNFQ